MRIQAILVLASTVVSVPAFAGSTITTNLPANTVIVNIDARADGASNSANNFGTWFNPFSTDVSYTFAPGTYKFAMIDPRDASVAYPSLTSGQLGSMFTAWTFNSPWLTDWMAFDSSAVTSGAPQLFFGAVAPSATGNAQDSYDLAKSLGILSTLSIPGRSYTEPGTLVSETYTFATTQTLLFAIPDQGVSDNAGGVSLAITTVVPEPTTSAMLLPVGLAALARRRRA